MEFRELPDDRSVQRPSLDLDELIDATDVLRGDLDVDGQRVSGDHAGEHAEGTITQSLLSEADLSGTRYRALALTDVACDGVDLSNAMWDRITARRVEFRNCRAVAWRVQFDQLADLYAGDCRLDYATVDIGRVRGLAVFERCSFREATIIGDLSSTVFLDCDFARAEFAVGGAKDCDLRSSKLADAWGLLRLSGAVISADQAVSIAIGLATEAGIRIADLNTPTG